MASQWQPQELPGRAPGKATENGRPVCPCALWAREIDDNFRAAYHDEAELDHAPLCDGHGNPRAHGVRVMTRAVVRVLDTRTQTLGRRCHVVRTLEGLALGTIYCQAGDALTADEVAMLLPLRESGHEVTLSED